MTATSIYRTNWDHTSLLTANPTGKWATNFAADLRHRRFNGDFGGYRRIEVNCPSLDHALDIVGGWMSQPDNVHMFAPVDLINN